MGWIPGSGRTPGEGHDNTLQYPCLENCMQREASELQSMGSQSQTQLRRLSTHTRLYLFKSPIVCLCLFCALCEWHIAFCHLPLPSQHNVYYLSTICIAVVHFLCHYHVALCGYAQVIDLFSCWWPLGLLLVFHCCYCRHCSDLIYASGIQVPSENISLGCRVRNAFTGLEGM